MDIIKPAIHLNGSSARNLAEGYAEAANKLREALDAMAKASPHGRDYYVLPGEALARAQREHQSRMDRVASVRAELEELMLYCLDREK